MEPDHEQLGRCVYPVASNGTPTYEDDCGEAAAYRVWWDDYDAAWLVCPTHYAVMTGQAHQYTNLQAQLATASQREKLTGDFYLDLQRIHQETLIELATARADAEALAAMRDAYAYVMSLMAGRTVGIPGWREAMRRMDKAIAALANHEALKTEASRSREVGE